MAAYESNDADPTPVDPEAEWAEQGTNLRNWLLMILERKWYALAVFGLIFSGATLYTFLATPIYEGVATVQILKHGAQVLRVADVVESAITSDTDFNTQIKILESVTMIQNVVARLSPEELKQLTAPFARSGVPPNPVVVIYPNRKILPQRLSFLLAIQYRHPDPKIAARVANLFASEYIAYNSRVRVEESLKAVDELKERADQQRKRVDETANALQAFRQRGNLISLVQSKDIVTERLKALNIMATQTNSHLKEAEVRWNQVRTLKEKGGNLADLPFIATQSSVNQLIQQITLLKLNLAQLRERYKNKHPKYIDAEKAVTQAEMQLQAALANAEASIKSEYENALQTDEGARKALADQETRSLEMDKSAVEYDNLNREYRVNDQLLESMLARMRETSVSSSIETDNARIIDRSPEPSKPVSPNIPLNLAVGAVAGLFFGCIAAYLVALVDDRIKTAFDVETLIGLPLVGVIPDVAGMDQPEKAQIVANGGDRAVTEAFLSIYSSLRLNNDSRAARLLLVTSSVPGEGKSFVASNLALTFASQGERTLLIDCDLRRPTVQRSFRLRAGKGLVNFCLRGTPLEEIVFRDIQPGLDIIPVGMRCKNPIQLLNSKEFEMLVAELARQYDRIVFDTPPLAAVSDGLNLLQLVDGAIYTVRFNGVKRRIAQRCARQLIATNVPVFGAVLNGMTMSVEGSYYVDNQTFREYYDTGHGSTPGAGSSDRRHAPRGEPAPETN